MFERDLEPELQDEVTHKISDMSGTVISKYLLTPNSTLPYIDVRGVNDKIYYGSPASNWTVVKKCDE